MKWVIFEAKNLEHTILSLDYLRKGKKDIVVFEKRATHEAHMMSNIFTEHRTMYIQLKNFKDLWFNYFLQHNISYINGGSLQDL